MAVAQGNIILAPSSDKKTKAELDSTSIESGLYYCTESVSICGYTNNRWAVTCISNELRGSLHCFAQIWMPYPSGSAQLARPYMFIRTSADGSTGYSGFSAMIPSNLNFEMYIQSTKPPVEPGKTKVWIDTSN